MSDQMTDLKSQIEVSIDAMQLQLQLQSSGEVVLTKYLEKYQKALKAFESGSPEYLEKCLRALLNCARGYMEFSSSYDQAFLHEMWETENIIKKKFAW